MSFEEHVEATAEKQLKFLNMCRINSQEKPAFFKKNIVLNHSCWLLSLHGSEKEPYLSVSLYELIYFELYT